MSFEASSLMTELAAVALAGAAIKLMDDYLDRAQDTAVGRPSLANTFGAATATYALVLAVIATGIRARLAAPLVLAAYAVGMFKDPRQMLPIGLPAWLESALVVIVMNLLVGWRAACVAVALMVAVQLADDLWDYALDNSPSSSNLARMTGKGAAVIVCGIAILLALVLDVRTTLLVCGCAPAVAAAARIIASSGGEPDDG